MKRTRTILTALLALAGLAVGQSTARAQATASDGDLLLGVRATSGAGTNQDYVIKLGTAATFRDATSIINLPLTGVGSDLSSAPLYGAGWYSRTDVLWGVVGKTSNFSAVGGDATSTLYASRAEPVNGTLAAPWPRRSASSQSYSRNQVDGLANTFNQVATPATNASTIAKVMASSESNGWTAYQPGGGLSGGISFQTWDPSIDGTPQQYLDLIRLEKLPNATPAAGVLLGRMVLNSNASLTFIPAALIGVNEVQFSAATFSASENVVGGKLTATVTRSGDTSLPASVTISTSESSATDPEDYTEITNQAVNFAVGEASKDVLIDIVNNPATQGDRSFNLALGGASGSITLGTQSTAVATITDAALPSEVSLQSAVFTANQGATMVPVTLTRTGGTAAFTVTFTTTNDTAQAGTDYTAPATTFNFPANQTTATVNITLTPNGATQHRVFNIALSAPSGDNTLGTLTSGVVRILAADANKPTVTIGASTPAASVLENLSNTVTIAGSATDGLGIIGRVEVQLNGDAVVNAELNPTASGASYSLTVTPVGGLNTVKVQAFDASGNASLVVTKTFTYVVKRTLTVNVTPALSGSVTGATANIQVGKPILLTAKPAAGFIFDHWSGAGLAGPATEVAILKVVMTDALAAAPTITATFVANPFTPAVIGEFNGLAIADGSSTPSNATNGMISMLKVTGTGTFTGTLKIDGLSLALTGLFDNTGVGKFGPTRTTTLLVARPGKPSYELALNMDVATVANTNQITGTLKQRYRTALVSNSIVTLDRAAFSAAAPVPSQYLLNKGLYTVVFPARATQVGLTAADYPQGDGVGSLTVTNLGKATLAGTLADGTAFTCFAPLSKTRTAPLFVQLYTLKAGSLGGLATLDDAQTDSDVSGTDFFWFRPYQNVHYYPWGWPEGIEIDLVGTKFAVPVGASVVPLLPAGPPNATLTFSEGLLSSAVAKDVQISATNAVTKYSVFPALDTSYTLTITAAKGTIAGTFTHTNGSKPKFMGVILQKGANREAFGHFLTVQPKPITGLGESGAVSLVHK